MVAGDAQSLTPEPTRAPARIAEPFRWAVERTVPIRAPEPTLGRDEQPLGVSVPPTPAPTAKPKPKAAKPKPKPLRFVWPSGAYRPWRTFSANVTRARQYALARLESVQFNCLDRLFTRESGWRVHAQNKSSGAYDIPQALPGRKMAKFGSDWRDNATTQVKWGISYVNGRYGSACNALSHSYRTGWY